MKPFYQDSACTIYLGDCREVLPHLPRARMLLSSPPYNVGKNGMKDGSGRQCSDKYRGLSDELEASLLDALSSASTDIRFVNVQMLSANRITIIRWLSRHESTFKDCIIWGKSNPPPQIEPGVLNSAHEYVFAFGDDGLRKFDKCEWQGTVSSVFWCPVNSNKFAAFHGAVFPDALAQFFISTFSSIGDTVVDGCMGLGTTLRAAKDLHRHSIGVEINEEYCEIAARRLQQEVLPLNAPVVREPEREIELPF